MNSDESTNPPTENLEDTDQQETQASDSPQTAVDELFLVERAVSERTKKIEELKHELKLQNEMLTSYLENDERYREAKNDAKEATKKKSAIKRELLSKPEAGDLPQKVKELRDQMADYKDGLSYYLREYQRLSGSSEIESDDGEVKQIVYTARLVSRSVFKK